MALSEDSFGLTSGSNNIEKISEHLKRGRFRIETSLILVDKEVVIYENIIEIVLNVLAFVVIGNVRVIEAVKIVVFVFRIEVAPNSAKGKVRRINYQVTITSERRGTGVFVKTSGIIKT